MEFGTLLELNKKRLAAAAAEALIKTDAEERLQSYTALSDSVLAFIQQRSPSDQASDERRRLRFSEHKQYNTISRLLLKPIVLGTDPDTQTPVTASLQASEVFEGHKPTSGVLAKNRTWSEYTTTGQVSSIKIAFWNGPGAPISVSTCGMEPAAFLDNDIAAEVRATSIWGDVEDVVASLAMLGAADPSK
jgi:hypothetical protein